MGYPSLRACVDDLERTGQLVRVDAEIDPRLEMAEVQRRLYRKGGPAVLFTRPKGTSIPMLGNLFGTLARARWIFRDALDGVRLLVDAKIDPRDLLRRPRALFGLPSAAASLLPVPVRDGPVRARELRVSELPALVSWPDDGGPFVTLPQVYTEDPERPGLRHSNLGMYRVQLAGNDYAPDREVGLHYQIHRGIGVHHAAALRRGEPLRVAVFVGGPPAMTLAAVMPLPEGLPEIAFAGVLNRRNVRMIRGPLHVHAVDAAGVHPLLLAVGSERYTPYAPLTRPAELLTQASAILGQGQMSLAKWLFVAAEGDAPGLDPHDVPGFFAHVLARLDPRRDLHFVCNTTMDTLDYSGTGLNEGSKVIVAAAGPARRTLPTTVPPLTLPDGFRDARVVLPGVLVVEARADAERFCVAFDARAPINAFPLVVLVDDAAFAAASLENFLWVTFTRSDPARDVRGVEAFVVDKAWGCHGSVVIDARRKPHHAAPLLEDPAVTRRVDALFAKGGPLHRLD